MAQKTYRATVLITFDDEEITEPEDAEAEPFDSKEDWLDYSHVLEVDTEVYGNPYGWCATEIDWDSLVEEMEAP